MLSGHGPMKVRLSSNPASSSSFLFTVTTLEPASRCDARDLDSLTNAGHGTVWGGNARQGLSALCLIVPIWQGAGAHGTAGGKCSTHLVVVVVPCHALWCTLCRAYCVVFCQVVFGRATGRAPKSARPGAAQCSSPLGKAQRETRLTSAICRLKASRVCKDDCPSPLDHRQILIHIALYELSIAL
jgi:hypothetical protein